MANVISMKQLLEAGVHFGHQTRRWNPKMAEYIFTERNGIYIIDLQKTVKKVEEAYYFVRDIAASGEDILFVGTKKQAQDSIKEEAERVGLAVCLQTSRQSKRELKDLLKSTKWKKTVLSICYQRRKLLS